MIALYYLGKTEKLNEILQVYLSKYPEGIAHAQNAWPKILFDEVLVGKMNFALQAINKLASVPA